MIYTRQMKLLKLRLRLSMHSPCPRGRALMWSASITSSAIVATLSAFVARHFSVPWSGWFCGLPCSGLGHAGEQLDESHRRLLQRATRSLSILDRERIPHLRNSFHVIGAAGQTTVRARPHRAYGNSVLPSRHLAAPPDQIPCPLDDSRVRPHP